MPNFSGSGPGGLFDKAYAFRTDDDKAWAKAFECIRSAAQEGRKVWIEPGRPWPEYRWAVMLFVGPRVEEEKEPFKNLSKPFKSNADRLRSMSDEELAETLRSLTDCVRCFAWDKDECDVWQQRPCYTGEIPCKEMWIRWLRKEEA